VGASCFSSPLLLLLLLLCFGARPLEGRIRPPRMDNGEGKLAVITRRIAPTRSAGLPAKAEARIAFAPRRVSSKSAHWADAGRNDRAKRVSPKIFISGFEDVARGQRRSRPAARPKYFIPSVNPRHFHLANSPYFIAASANECQIKSGNVRADTPPRGKTRIERAGKKE